jgi:LysM repeat protein
VAKLGIEAEDRIALEKESVTGKAYATRNTAAETEIARQPKKPTSGEKPGEGPTTEGQEEETVKRVMETVHVVQTGENLYRIGRQYGVSWKTLMKFNNLADPNSIYSGQRLRIPRSETAEPRQTSLVDET